MPEPIQPPPPDPPGDGARVQGHPGPPPLTQGGDTGAVLEDAPAARALAAWVSQWVRALKTCRLYDAGNPTVLQMRRELAAALPEILARHGPLELTFSTDGLLHRGVPLRRTQAGPDELTLAFVREGIRELSFVPGLEASEVEALLDVVLRATRPGGEEEDLVALLWNAELPHVEVRYLSLAGDLEGGGPAEVGAEGDGTVSLWPQASGGAAGPLGSAAAGIGATGRFPAGPAGAAAGAAGGAEVGGAPDGGEGEGRSDDRITLGPGADLEAAFAALDRSAPQVLEQFAALRAAEERRALTESALEMLRVAAPAGAGAPEGEELAGLLLRVLHQAIADGAWDEARAALAGGSEPGLDRRLQSRLAADLARADSLTTRRVVERLNRPEAPALESFVALALALGPEAVGWLMRVLAESGQRRVRRQLTQTVAQLSRDDPARLAPWLTDPRWYVVRNAVHVLGYIGGPAILDLLRAASHHREPRVRQEVAAALGQVDPDLARPVLLEMLGDAEGRVLTGVLRQLAQRRDPEVARLLLAWVLDERFRERPEDQQHHVWTALGAVGGDDLLPALEAELYRNRWLSRGQYARRREVARCLARLGTPAAQRCLARGAASGWGPAARVCAEALSGGGGTSGEQAA
ncbi:MAG TPA: HEAT repeat domain-containing protein [Candidatus Saccharimonadales bacterium]|nr:HEAT repeat domain-containing protein [Candidatus Saccharimonadales bacterium]